jgi:hypothetical protein
MGGDNLGDAGGTARELFFYAVRPPALPPAINVVLAPDIIKS